jgi:hypothetical protein
MRLPQRKFRVGGRNSLVPGFGDPNNQDQVEETEIKKGIPKARML